MVSLLTIKRKTVGMANRSDRRVEEDGGRKRDRTGVERVTNSMLMTIYRLFSLTAET